MLNTNGLRSSLPKSKKNDVPATPLEKLFSRYKKVGIQLYIVRVNNIFDPEAHVGQIFNINEGLFEINTQMIDAIIYTDNMPFLGGQN